MKDLRDPKELGGWMITLGSHNGLRATYDDLEGFFLLVPPYDANPSCIEKYGRPQDLPPTPF